jgi:phage terminase small subunit
MPKARDPRRDEAYELWAVSKGQRDLVEIADQLGVTDGTLRGWKSKDKWEKKLNGTLPTEERNATKKGMERSERMERSETPQEQNEKFTEENADDLGLTERERLFAMEYLRDFNITRAAIAAGYSKKTAHVTGWEVLRRPKVQRLINKYKELRTAELGLDIQRIIAEYMKIAFADITDVMEFGQRIVPITDEEGKVIFDPESGEGMTTKENFVVLKNSDEIDGTVVSEVKQGRTGVSIKLHDKLRALEKLERYLDFMTEEDRLKLEKLRLEVKVLNEKGW